MVQGNVTDADVAELVRDTAEAASAYTRGYSQISQETTPRMFRGGEADLELVQSYASGDIAVLVAIEADPLVHAMSMEHMASLARGQG